MKPKKKKKSMLFNENIDLKQRLFVLNLIVTLTVLAITFIEIIFTDEFLIDSIMLAVVMAFIVLVGIISVKTGKVGIGGVIIATLMSFGYFPITFINGGGINGDAPLWFIFNVLFVSMVLSGKVKIVFYVLQLLTAAACYFVGVAYPDIIHPNTYMMSHIYSFTALVFISIAVSVVIGLETGLYEKENKRSVKQKREIENLIASQNQFFSSMSHEIRTPINTIIGLNEMILREDVSDEVAEDAANIRAAGKLLLSLINDILDMSKFQSGQMHLTNVTYYTGNMLSDIVGMLWIRAKEKKLEFKINVSPDIPAELVGDEFRIKQILINILNNAIKYTKEGSISLSVQCERKNNDTVNMIYTITDTGIGIKKEDIPYLFTAFKRVDETENQHIEGTGLGLSIVKQLLDLMGGKITVNSIYTKGSTFIIEIPQKTNGEKQVGEFDYEKNHHIAKKGEYKQKFEAPDAKVLVVDDNESNILVVKKLLRATKVRIDTAVNGVDALGKTLNDSYNVIFMDHLMPEMDGIECFKKLRNQVGGNSRNAKVVILTANAGEEERELYRKEGFDGYLVKPVSGDDLESELYRLLPKDIVHVKGNSEEIINETISWMRVGQKKKNVVITTESVADLPKEILEKYDVQVIAHKVQTVEGTFKDGREIDTAGVLQYMEDKTKKILPLAPDVKEHESFFAKQLSRANNVVHVSISGKIENSGYPVAKEASRAFDNVHVFDSGHLSSGQGILVIEACKMAEEGLEPEEIVERLEKIRSKIHTSFIVDNLDFLARSKQVGNRTANFVKSLMGRPVLVLKRGKMGVGRIYFGSRKRAWKKYIDSTLSNMGRIDRSILFVTYVGISKRDQDWIRSQIVRKGKFEEIYFRQASPAIAVNCGAGTFGLLLKDKG